MSPSSTEYVRRGDFAPNLSEYISREARFKLVKAVVQAIETEISYHKGLILKTQLNRNVSQFGACRIFAKYIGVTPRCVQNWLAKTYQSCNVNAEKLLKLALQYAPEETFIVLDEDLEAHRFLFEYVAFGVRSGVFAPKREVVA